ncbi:MAG: glycosyl hydrolase [Planctomycetes bacterium]|nr:glycosyl hydrolase [Planctomycetota bacterium]
MQTKARLPRQHPRPRPAVTLFATVAVAAASLVGATSAAAQTATAPVQREITLGTHRDKPKLEMGQVFTKERFPNVAVAVNGTVLATWGTSALQLRRSEDGGETWGDPIVIASGFQSGGLTVDERSGDVIAFVEERHPPAPLRIYRSKDHGKTWKQQETVVGKDSRGNVPSMHMNDHGITLRHGKFKGRLLRPSRWYAGKNDHSKWPQHYTNAVYSDDGGVTWSTSDPFPAMGTGEATVAELSDGTIYYNSRRHWAEPGANPRRRWTARSTDGGQTWKDLEYCAALPDGPQDTNYGCMGGLARLPIKGRDILLYSNCDSPRGRNHGTIWASFDGGRTWPIKRLVFEQGFGYSSLVSGRPGTRSAGLAYVHFEGGPHGGSTVARFNLPWVLGGEKTGDGKVPAWALK